jgi:hypothetical protein
MKMTKYGGVPRDLQKKLVTKGGISVLKDWYSAKLLT